MTKTDTEINAMNIVLAKYTDIHDIEINKLAAEILKETNKHFGIHNGACAKDEKWQKRHTLSPAPAAELLLAYYPIRLIDLCPDAPVEDKTILGIYNPDTGIYETDRRTLKNLIYKMDKNYPKKDMEEIEIRLESWAETVNRTTQKNLVPVKNGIFDFTTKTLMPFSPDYVYLNKCPINYVPNAASPVIHNPNDGTDWEIEEWMQMLSDDPDIIDLLWKIIGACVRPFAGWGKVVWFYSTSGNSGKGTLCRLMRNLCGAGNHASISLSEFDGNPFLLSSLIHASAVITDENNVGHYIEKSKNLKTAATGDMLYIDRKYKNPVTYRYQGVIIECVNELPRIRDKSGSYARRQLLVPFEKCFTGTEREYIKNDYLQRTEVLEYVLQRVLNMNYDKLPVPAACEGLLAEYKETNDPIRAFLSEMLPELVWDLVPFSFLYALYLEWTKKNNPKGSPCSSISFKNETYELLKAEDFGFFCDDKNKTIRSMPKMDKPEPLILEYGLTDWMNQTYKGNDPDKLCLPSNLRPNYRGILRKP